MMHIWPRQIKEGESSTTLEANLSLVPMIRWVKAARWKDWRVFFFTISRIIGLYILFFIYKKACIFSCNLKKTFTVDVFTKILLDWSSNLAKKPPPFPPTNFVIFLPFYLFSFSKKLKRHIYPTIFLTLPQCI